MTTITITRPALKISGLRKSFGAKVVLDGLDLQVEAGTDHRVPADRTYRP